METVATSKIAQQGNIVLRIGTVAAVFVLLCFACLGGWLSGTGRGQAEATYEGVVQLHAALANFKADQGEFPSAYQFSTQEVLQLLYISSMPVPQDARGACAKYPSFQYSLVGSQDYSVVFCLSAAAANLAAGVHTLSSGGIDVQ